MPFKGFLKSSNFYREFLKYPVFGPTLTPIYLLQMIKIQNSCQVIQINQNQGPISFQFSMKTIITLTFALFGVFLGTKGPSVKDQEVTA